MIMLHGILSKYGPTNYQEIDREKDGSVKFDETKLVYMLSGQMQNTDNKVRNDIPLSIDIWYKIKDIYTIEDMVEDIDNELSDLLWRSESGLIIKIARASNYTMNIPDSNKDIRRKQMNYVVRYYR